MDMFLHLKQHHDSDDHFEYIYDHLPNCQVNHCDKFKRNYRNRSAQHVREERHNPPIQEILDKIHCYFKHSFDMGYRFTAQERKQMTVECKIDDREPCPIDMELKALQTVLTEKKNNSPFNSDDDITNTKYKYTELQNIQCQFDEKIYSFGTPIYYRDMPNAKANVSPKYSCLSIGYTVCWQHYCLCCVVLWWDIE
eukprot:408212_1